MIGRSFVDSVSGLKTTCNSLDQPEYPLSVSSVQGETSEKADCELTVGLNSLRKAVRKVSEKAECSGADQRSFAPAPPTKL